MTTNQQEQQSRSRVIRRRLSTIICIILSILISLYFILDTTPGLYLYDKWLWKSTLLFDDSSSSSFLSSSSSHQYKYHQNNNIYPSLTNKTIWITGASSGIGADLVCLLLHHTQVQHVILSSRRYDKLLSVAQKCSPPTPPPTSSSDTTGNSHHIPTVSIVEYDALETNNPNRTTKHIVQEALSTSPTGSIDIVILNAGIYQSKVALETSIEETKRLLRVNFEAPIELAMELIKQDSWKEKSMTTTSSNGGGGNGRRRPQLVLVNSLMGRGPASLSSSYAASKAGIRNYFLTLSTEEWTWLQVNIALPGATRTGLWDSLGTSKSNPNGGDTTTTNDTPPQPMMKDDDDTMTSTKRKIRPDEGTLMDSTRVAQLILSGMVGPRILFTEMWIAQYSGILYAYLSAYAPFLFMCITHVAGLVRVVAAREEQLDVLELTGMISRFIRMIFGYYPYP